MFGLYSKLLCTLLSSCMLTGEMLVALKKSELERKKATDNNKKDNEVGKLQTEIANLKKTLETTQKELKDEKVKLEKEKEKSQKDIKAKEDGNSYFLVYYFDCYNNPITYIIYFYLYFVLFIHHIL